MSLEEFKPYPLTDHETATLAMLSSAQGHMDNFTGKYTVRGELLSTRAVKNLCFFGLANIEKLNNRFVATITVEGRRYLRCIREREYRKFGFDRN